MHVAFVAVVGGFVATVDATGAVGWLAGFALDSVGTVAKLAESRPPGAGFLRVVALEFGGAEPVAAARVGAGPRSWSALYLVRLVVRSCYLARWVALKKGPVGGTFEAYRAGCAGCNLDLTFSVVLPSFSGFCSRFFVPVFIFFFPVFL